LDRGGARLPFGRAKWDYQPDKLASLGGTMTIAAVLKSKGSQVETIAADATLFDAVRKLGEKRIGALPVIDSGRIAGIMSERDVIYCLRDHGPDVLEWPVHRVMSSLAVTVDSSTPIMSALALITQRRIRHLPVVDNGELKGLVSIGDLVKHRMERIEAEAEAMRAYIQSA
jgi:CBS domain-containing protein